VEAFVVQVRSTVKQGGEAGADAAAPLAPRFYSVAQAARLLGMSSMTLYRAISDGEFPAVRVRGRLIVPAKAIEVLADAAVSMQAVVDAAEVVLHPRDVG
jgi:excisionase family DNA binding protein